MGSLYDPRRTARGSQGRSTWFWNPFLGEEAADLVLSLRKQPQNSWGEEGCRNVSEVKGGGKKSRI